MKPRVEGIETARQFERLVGLGCHFGQEYYFAQPMEAKAALAFIGEQIARAKAGK